MSQEQIYPNEYLITQDEVIIVIQREIGQLKHSQIALTLHNDKLLKLLLKKDEEINRLKEALSAKE